MTTLTGEARRCLDCPVSFVLGSNQAKKVRCDRCSKLRRYQLSQDSKTKLREKAQGVGLCGCCAKRAPKPGAKVCDHCLAIQKETPSRKAKRDRGLAGPSKRQLAHRALFAARGLKQRGCYVGNAAYDDAPWSPADGSLDDDMDGPW